MLYTPKETSPLLLFRLSGGKKNLLCRQWVICTGLQHVCMLALDCHWDGWLVLLVYLCSPQHEPRERSKVSGTAWSGVAVETVFLGRPVCGALKATSSLVWLTKKSYWLHRMSSDWISNLLSLRFPHNAQKQAQYLHGQSNCNTWYISVSLPQD